MVSHGSGIAEYGLLPKFKGWGLCFGDVVLRAKD